MLRVNNPPQPIFHPKGSKIPCPALAPLAGTPPQPTRSREGDAVAGAAAASRALLHLCPFRGVFPNQEGGKGNGYLLAMKIFTEATRTSPQPVLPPSGPGMTPADVTGDPPRLCTSLQALVGNRSLTAANHPLNSQHRRVLCREDRAGTARAKQNGAQRRVLKAQTRNTAGRSHGTPAARGRGPPRPPAPPRSVRGSRRPDVTPHAPTRTRGHPRAYT